MFTENPVACLDQLERNAEALERIADLMERCAALMEPEPEEAPEAAASPERVSHFSLFLEQLSTWHYNNLRRKNIPTTLAAKILGVSTAQLTYLDRHNRLKGKSGRYDILSLLSHLESEVHPEWEGRNAA